MTYIFSEIFPTCSSLYYFFYFKRLESENNIKINNEKYTIDPDEAGPLEPFVVTCTFSVTNVPVIDGNYQEHVVS